MTNHTCRSILILGVSSEIGLALALKAMGIKDSRLLLVSRSKVNPLLQKINERCRYVHGLDLTIESDLLALRAEALDFFQEPFSVVHSVGDFWIHKPLIETSFREIRTMYESHYLTLCGVAYSLIPVLIERGGGHLVAFSCNSVMYNYPDMAPFTSAKAAVESLVKCLANEYAEHGVWVTGLALPTIKTQRVIEEKIHGDHASYITPSDLAEILLENILRLPLSTNGNIVKVFKYSRSFFHEGYFERNPRRESHSTHE